MAHVSAPTVVEQRRFGNLIQLQLSAPELAGGARPGQFLLLPATSAGFHDPLLNRALFVAGADPAAHSLSLLLPTAEVDLHWLAERRVGDELRAFGPVGTPFVEPSAGANLLLLGTGPGLFALLFLARRALERKAAVELLAVAVDNDSLPPPYLLPADAGYQAATAAADSLVDLLSPQLIGWADHIAVAAPIAELPAISAVIRRHRLRWPAGFAEVVLAGPIPCVSATCRACLVQTRAGLRSRCRVGPVFDLRELP
jgi:dihydroorotate dehydrogenase electron transfer subunit